MSKTETLRAALQAAREARGSIPLGAERSALNVALDRLDVALSAAAALAQQPAETDAELQRRTGEPHIDGWPLYSGLPPAASGEPPEPFGYVITHNFPEGHAYRYSFYTPKSIGTAYRDTALSITPVFANAQPAPAPAASAQPVTLADVLDALNLFNRPKPSEDDGPWEGGHFIRVDHLPDFINIIAAAWFAQPAPAPACGACADAPGDDGRTAAVLCAEGQNHGDGTCASSDPRRQVCGDAAEGPAGHGVAG